jgi:Family of unknown function (DUF6519)
MAGDYTRATFDPHRDHAGVLMQQGRVTLDADWNELVELVDRRLRAETIDIIGRCVVPRETPDGFAIGLSGGTMTIGQGRAYVHGILTECHGAEPDVYDPVLGEVHGTQPIAYEKQPYFPNAAAVAPLPTTGTYLAYLDVWRREVTALEEPELLEKAIAVDTSTRLQTAWQVRLLEVPDGTTCSSDVPAWNDLIAPSAGRLTTAAVGVPVDDDPCTVPPTGGYRGTENRLYRVEVHDHGPLGTATFKWSRDDASIAFPVTGIDTARTKLTVTRVGRDSVARISIGDWVEITDDWRELNGLPGELRKVAGVDDGDETITLAAALPSGGFDPLDGSRHTRVTRWDQSGVAVDAAGGVMQVPAVAGQTIVLEDGVQVAFDVDPTVGGMHSGDYWVFAARTADASVEELTAAPPRGILHHFCRLAVVTFPSGTPIDCRTFWPPDFGGDGHDCSCAACVTPESHASGQLTIQMAVDQVKSRGGKVCLQPGFYFLDGAIRITGAQSLELEGKGWRTILVTAGREPAIVVQASLGVTIDSLTILTSSLARVGALPAGIAIALRNTIGTAIERCVLAQLGAVRRDTQAGTTLTHEATTTGFASVGPQAAGAPLIALDGFVVETLVDENVLIGTTGIGSIWGALTSELGFQAMEIGLEERLRSSAAESAARGSGYVLTYDLAIEDNLFVCFLTGVSLEGFTVNVGETRVLGNSVLGGLRVGIACTGFTLPLMSRVDVVGNMLEVFGFGIAVATDDTRVADNDVFGLMLRGVNLASPAPATGFAAFTTVSAGATTTNLRRGDAIVLSPGLRPSGIDRCQVRGNRVARVLGNAISIRTDVVSAQISHNTVQAVGGCGITMREGSSATALTVEGNQILAAGAVPDPAERIAGILLQNGEDVAVAGNTVRGVGSPGAVGILVGDCRALRVTGNDVAGVGVPDSGGGGIEVSGDRITVADNSVRRASDPADKLATEAEWYGIFAIGNDPQPVDEAVSSEVAIAGALSRTFLARNAATMLAFDPKRGRVVVLPRGRSTIAVHGNLVESVGSVQAVYMQTRGSCVFSDNRVFLLTRQSAVAKAFAGALVASANYLEGLEKLAALDLTLPAAAGFTVSGNVSSGPVVLNGGALPSPWDQLNVP